MQDKTIIVDGKEFVVTPFAVRKALGLEAKLLAMLGPGLGGLKDTFKELNLNNFETKDIDFSFVPGFITEAINSIYKLDPELNIVFDVLQETLYKGPNNHNFKLNNDEAVNRVFAGNNIGLFKLFFEVIKANGFFIGQLTGVLSGLKEAANLSSTAELSQS